MREIGRTTEVLSAITGLVAGPPQKVCRDGEVHHRQEKRAEMTDTALE